MKKLILLAFLAGALAGMFFAYRWLRGETAFEEAVRELEAEPDVGAGSAPGSTSR